MNGGWGVPHYYLYTWYPSVLCLLCPHIIQCVVCVLVEWEGGPGSVSVARLPPALHQQQHQLDKQQSAAQPTAATVYRRRVVTAGHLLSADPPPHPPWCRV